MADAKARIAYNFDTWNAGTITSSSEANADLADDNCVHDFISLPWRTDTDSSEWWKIDLGSATNIKCVVIAGHNFTAAATVVLEGHTSDSWGAPTYQETLTILTNADGVVRPYIVVFLDESLQWWRLTVTDAANPDGYIEIGVIRGESFYEFDRNFNEAFGIPMADPSEGENIPGRQTYKRSRKRYRRAEIEVVFMDDTQRRKFEAIFEKIGNEKPCVLALDPTNNPSELSMYCYLLTPLALTHVMTDQFAVRLAFGEVTE